MSTLDLDLHRISLTLTSPINEVFEDLAKQEMTRRFSAKLVMERQDPYVYFTPANWWEHFKESWPRWIRKWFSASSVAHIIDVKTIYPTLVTKIPLDVTGPIVTILLDDRPAGSFLSDTDGLTLTGWKAKVSSIKFRDRYCQNGGCPVCGRILYR